MILPFSINYGKLKQLLTKPFTNSLFNIFIISLYSITAVSGVLYHEPWRDEAQAWLIARDLSITYILKQMSYEGTPALWHFILIPFAKLGAPYFSEFIIHLIIGITIVTLFILYSPLPGLTRLLFVFSSYMAFEYTIVARNYSISILLLFLIAVLYPRRFKKPVLYSILIFLLFNTNAHSFFAGLALILIYGYESILEKKTNLRVQDYIAFGIMLAGPIIALSQLIPPPLNLAKTKFSFFYITYGTLITLLLLLVFLSLIKKFKVLFFLLLSASWVYFILILRNGGRRHYGILFILIITALWISKYYTDQDNLKLFKPDKSRLIRHSGAISLAMLDIILMVSVISTYISYKDEYLYYFSGSREMAEYINHNDYNKYIIVAHKGPQTSALLPYMPGKKFWYPEIESYGTFITWNKKHYRGTGESNIAVIGKIQRYFPQKKVLLLLSAPLKTKEARNFRLIHKTNKKVKPKADEIYYLYERIR